MSAPPPPAGPRGGRSASPERSANGRATRSCSARAPDPAAKYQPTTCQGAALPGPRTRSMLAAWLMFWLWSRPGCVRRWANRTRAPPSPSWAPTASRCSRFRDGRTLVRYATLGMSAAADDRPRPPALADPVAGPARRAAAVRTGRRSPTPTRCCARSPCSPPPRRSRASSWRPGASLDVGEPLWPGAPFTSVLVAEPGGLVEDLELDAPHGPGALPAAAADDPERGRLEAGARRRRRSRNAGSRHGLRDPAGDSASAGYGAVRAPD